LCRTRWGTLEQEGFGIVFLEASAAGIPQIAGRSGGAHEAVSHGETGLVIDPATPQSAAHALSGLLQNAQRCADMGAAARQRAENDFSYEVLAAKLATAIDEIAVV